MQRPWLAYLGLVALVCCVFGQTCQFEFLNWDDNYNVTQNARLNPPTLENTADFWRAPHLGLYAPLSYTLFSLEAAIARIDGRAGSQPNPAVFHATNLILHAWSTLLVFGIVRRLIQHIPAALMGAALFAIHPLQVESVAWVTEGRGLLAAGFSLAAIWFLVREVQASATISTRSLVAITLCTVLALLSKPSAAALPLALWIIGRHLECNRRQLLLVVGLTGALAVGLAVVTKWQQGNVLMNEVAPLWLRPVIALNAIMFYCRSVVWPTPLGPDYGWRLSWLVFQLWFWLAWIVPVIVAGLLYRYEKQRRVFRLGLLFAAFLLPVLGLVPFGFQEISSVADRYAYLPMFVVAWGAAWFLAPRWNFACGFLVCGVLVFFSALSAQQAAHWRNNEQFFSQMLRVNPESFAAHMNMGIESANDGQIPEGIALLTRATELNPSYPLAWFNLGSTQLNLAHYPEAVAALARANTLGPNKLETLTNLGRALIEFKQYTSATNVLTQAVEVDPRSREAHTNLADVHLRQRAFEPAEMHLKIATEIDPTFADAWLIFASLRRQQGRLDEAKKLLTTAIAQRSGYAGGEYALAELYLLQEDWSSAEAHFRRAAELNPNLPQARYQAGYCQLQMGKINEAVLQFEELIATYPQYVDPYHGLAQVMLRSGETRRAISLYEHALRMDPNWAMAQQALTWIYATSADPTVRNAPSAQRRAKELLERYSDAGPELLDVAAAAQAANGSYDQAVATAKKALELATQLGQQPLKERIERRLELYRAGEAFIDRQPEFIARGK